MPTPRIFFRPGESLARSNFGSKFLQHPLGRALWLGVAVFAVVMALAAQDLGRTLENAILDLCCRLQPASPPPREAAHRPKCARSAAAFPVCSQVNSGSVRPKCP